MAIQHVCGTANFSNHHLHCRFENGTVRLVHKSAHGHADAQMPPTVQLTWSCRPAVSAHGHADAQMPPTVQLTWPCRPAVCCAVPLLAHSSSGSLPPSCSSSSAALRSAPSPLVALPSCPCLPRCLRCPSPCPLSLRHLCPSGSPLCCFARPPTSLRSSGEPHAASAGRSCWRVGWQHWCSTSATPVPRRRVQCVQEVALRQALLPLCCLSVSFCPPLPCGVRRCSLFGALLRVVQCFLLSCLDARRGGVLAGVSECVWQPSAGSIFVFPLPCPLPPPPSTQSQGRCRPLVIIFRYTSVDL